MHISVLNGVLWDMEQMHAGIFELGQLSLWLLLPTVVLWVNGIELKTGIHNATFMLTG